MFVIKWSQYGYITSSKKKPYCGNIHDPMIKTWKTRKGAARYLCFKDDLFASHCVVEERT